MLVSSDQGVKLDSDKKSTGNSSSVSPVLREVYSLSIPPVSLERLDSHLTLQKIAI